MEHRRHRRPLAVGVAGLLLAVLALGSQLGTTLVVSHPLPRVDAIVSLASHEWERLPVAARAAAAHPQALMLLTEPQPVTPYNCHDCDHRADRLADLGVEPARVRVLPIAESSTHGEAVALLAFAAATGVRHLLVVTSPYHTRRALATFRAVFDGSGIAIGIEPARDSSPARPERWWWAGYDRAYVPYEWAAIVYYVWKHRLPVSTV